MISPDTRRAVRLPPGQVLTRKWPVLDAYGPPQIGLDTWRLRVDGLVRHPRAFTWEEFNAIEKINVFSDFHCVTRWSRLDNTWTGVAVSRLIELAGGAAPGARFVVAHGYDNGFTTNLPLEALLAADSLIATEHDGQPLTMEHGGPARLVVPALYAWKSAKWISRLELTAEDRAGFWERNGYHMNGDPWKEERFG